MRSVLLAFKAPLPSKIQNGAQRFDTIIAPRALERDIRALGPSFEPIEDFIDPGSIQEATALLGELARVTLPDGTRVAQSALYRGYELWWITYDDLMIQHCLPYTQYRRLLEHLTEFSSITLYTPPAAGLFSCFLEAHGCRYEMYGRPKTFPPVGIWLQVFLSVLSLPLLVLKRPKLMMYTGDLFDPPRDHSFRMRLIYEELRRRGIPFVEFIRSMESAPTMVAHALRRRRPVIYSYAIKIILSWAARFFGEKKIGPLPRDPEQAFKMRLATYYLRFIWGTEWSIRCMNLLLRSIGVRAALIPAGSSRTFHEVLGCRLAGIPSVGILHGAASKYYNVYDFMPEYSGTKRLSLDVYGVWSDGWREYYIKNSRIYTPEQLKVSGPMRPLEKGTLRSRTRAEGPLENDPIRVLLVPGELSDPEELMPYMRMLMEAKEVSLYLTFRPYRDGFENWLKEHHPEIIERVGKNKILLGNIHSAIAECDVVIGTYSTGVLEALLSVKPIIFFSTRKWGDYFDLKEYDPNYTFFAENTEELLECVKKSRTVPIAVLKKLQERFFGDPYRNGSAWVIDEIEKRL